MEKSVRDKINVGHYETTIPYPIKPDKPSHGLLDTAEEAYDFSQSMDAWKNDMEIYQKELKRYLDSEKNRMFQFYADVLKETGLTMHPKSDKAYSLAWQRGHSSGLGQVLFELEIFADLLLSD